METDRGLKRRCSLHREGCTKSGRVESGMLKGNSEKGSSFIPLFINVPGGWKVAWKPSTQGIRDAILGT